MVHAKISIPVMGRALKIQVAKKLEQEAKPYHPLWDPFNGRKSFGECAKKFNTYHIQKINCCGTCKDFFSKGSYCNVIKNYVSTLGICQEYERNSYI